MHNKRTCKKQVQSIVDPTIFEKLFNKSLIFNDNYFFFLFHCFPKSPGNFLRLYPIRVLLSITANRVKCPMIKLNNNDGNPPFSEEINKIEERFVFSSTSRRDIFVPIKCSIRAGKAFLQEGVQ